MRLRNVSKLVLGLALAAAGAVRAQAPAADFFDLNEKAGRSFDKEDWPLCATQFAGAAEKAPTDRQAARAFLNASRCATQAGNKDAAFRYFDQAAAHGCRDVDGIVTDTYFDPLRQDPRWKPAFEKVQARAATSRKGPINAELERLYNEDQADRAQEDKIDWKVVDKRDEERRKRVLEIVGQGGAKEAADYVHAAMVFQHGHVPEDYEKAHEWCLKAVEIDPDYPGARWLAAASKDRYLMNLGKPQLYGTQYRKDRDGPWYLWQVDPSITDEERAKWDVPPLARAKARAELMNAEH